MANITKIENETIEGTSDESSFNIINYGTNLNKQLIYIDAKIKTAEIKITALKTKESIIDSMINRSNLAVEKYVEEKNFKLVGINSGHILTQFETLAQVQEMLIKYEDMIQRYIKMSIDIENHKINAFVKLNASKKEADKAEEGYDKLMTQMHEMVTLSKNQSDPSQGDNPGMIDAVKEQLKLEGY